MNKQSRLVVGALATAIWLSPSVVLAQNADAGEAESFATVSGEYDAAYKEWNAAFRKARRAGASKEEVEKFFATRPKPAAYADRIEKIVVARPASEDGGAAAAWLVSRVRAKGAQLERALAVLSDHHGGSEHVQSVFFSLTRNPNPRVGTFLETQHSVCTGERRALACVSLAEHLKNTSATVRRIAAAGRDGLERDRNIYGRHTVDVLQGMDPVDLEQRAASWFERITKGKELVDVAYFGGTVGEHAASALFELQHLTVGKVAPDIIGEDIDGVSMKLSDYRGKVVVLDFWGDW